MTRTFIALALVSAFTLVSGCEIQTLTPSESPTTPAEQPESPKLLPAIDQNLAEAAARRDGPALWDIFKANGNVDTLYMRSAHKQGLKPAEQTMIKAFGNGNVSEAELQNYIFSARVSARACSVKSLAEACAIVGTAPQAELKAAAAKY